MLRLAGLVLLTAVTVANARELATGDGLSLQMDDRGAVTQVRVGADELRLTRPGGCYVADVAGIAAREVDLVDNPSFETLAAGRPTGWDVGQDWSLDQTVARTGRCSMKVQLAAARPSGGLSIELPVQPNTPYRVSMWLKTAGCAPSFYTVQLDAAGRPDPDHPQVCISHANKHSDWFQLSSDLVTSPVCRRLRVYSNLWHQVGTAWLDDVAVRCLADDYLTPQQLALGRVEPLADGVRQQWESPEQALAMTTTWRAVGDQVLVDGEVRDTSGRDRAVTVSVRLPLAAEGWTWYDDLSRRQAITPGVTYGAARVLGDRRVISLYPFAALGNDRAALALAVPLDEPRMFRLSYDTVNGYCLNWEFGLAKDATKHPRRATFQALLYRLDPRWGFRSAAQRYYELRPQHFTVRLSQPGGAGFMQPVADWNDPKVFPSATSIWNYHQREAKELHQREATRLYSYTEFTGWWGWALGITPEQAKQRPTPAAAWARVGELAQTTNPNQNVARCILNCVPHGRDGRRLLHTDYEAQWGGYNYLCNPDPEIEGIGGRTNRFSLTWEREVSQVDAFGLDGMYFDCAFVFAVDNFRREHFRWSDYPLVFDHQSKQPVLPMVFSIHECAKAIADAMHARGKTTMANYSVTDFATELFCAPLVDLLGNEMLWTWTGDPKLSLQRVLAYRKPVSMSWQEAKLGWPDGTKERELKQAMLYGTFYQLSRLDPELRERWVPLTRRLHNAGWEPITLASATGGERLRLERFGRVADGNLHFAVRNDGAQPATVALTFEAAPLGLAGRGDLRLWRARDSWAAEVLDGQRGDTAWTASLPVPAGDTVVLRVGAPADLARDQVAELPQLLTVAGAWRQALDAATTTPDYAGLAQPRLHRVALNALAEQLTEPMLGQVPAERAAWARRLRENVALAQRRVRAALAYLPPG